MQYLKEKYKVSLDAILSGIFPIVRLDGKRNQEDSDEEEAFDLAGSDLDDSDDDEKDGADEEVCFRESRSMHCAGG